MVLHFRSITVYPLLKHLHIHICLVFLLSWSTCSFSAVVEGLYNSSVEVESQQINARQEAFNEALLKVLLKLSGDRALVSDTTIQAEVFPAERFVQSFSYKENNYYRDYLLSQEALVEDEGIISQTDGVTDLNLTDNISKANNSVIPLKYVLNVEFSSEALNKTMKDLNIPVWGNVRPNIMLWGLSESEGERAFISQNTDNSVLDILSEVSETYALPISFPVGDEVDRNRIIMSDLWGLFPEAITEAKQRYTANGNVMIRFYQSVSGEWSANWFFELNELAYSGTKKHASLNELSEELLGFISKILSRRFSIQASTEGASNKQINIVVSNINTFKDYTDVQQFFVNLAPVKSLSISWLKGASIGLLVDLSGSKNQFNEYVKLSGKLKYIQTSVENDQLITQFEPESGRQPNTFEPLSETAGMTHEVTERTNVENNTYELYEWLSSSDTKL